MNRWQRKAMIALSFSSVKCTLGQGVKQDKAKALELFQMAAAQDNKNAKIQAEFLLKWLVLANFPHTGSLTLRSPA